MTRLLAGLLFAALASGGCAGPRVVTDITSRGDTVYVAWGERDGTQGVVSCTLSPAQEATSSTGESRRLSNCRHLRVLFEGEDGTDPPDAAGTGAPTVQR